MKKELANALCKEASTDPRFIFLTADLGYGAFENYVEQFPAQYLNVGIAEQNMISVASGLALCGWKVAVYSIGNFPTLRCLEQIRNDAAYHSLNVKVISFGGGFSYGNLGFSHHATEDIAIMRAIPGVSVYVPGTQEEVIPLFDLMLNSPGVSYMRLDKSSGLETSTLPYIQKGKWRLMRQGNDVAIIATGGALQEAQKASEVLKDSGIQASIINANQYSELDVQHIISLIQPNLVVTIEEHVITGGLAGIVSELIATNGLPKRLIPLGLRNTFVDVVGSQKYLRQQIGIDSASIVCRIKQEFGLGL